MKEWLESQEFYELMYAYRWADKHAGSPSDTVAAFEAVKAAILEHMEE